MKLSIIIPCHNDSAFLPRCLESVGKCEGVEVVVVDDGSRNEVSVDEKYRATVVRQEHSGVYAARRRGFQESHGDFVWFVDADDEVVEIPEIPDADLIRFRQENGWMCIGDKIYRRETAAMAFRELGDLDLKHCEDGLFHMAAMKHSKSVVDVDVPIYRYRKRAGSTMMCFNPDVVAEREKYVDLYMRLCPEGNLAELSKDSAVYVACALCRWPVLWRDVKTICRQLTESRLVADGREAIRSDPYARKMLFAVRHPFMIWLYLMFKRR